jgi:hypothetical protein
VLSSQFRLSSSCPQPHLEMHVHATRLYFVKHLAHYRGSLETKLPCRVWRPSWVPRVATRANIRAHVTPMFVARSHRCANLLNASPLVSLDSRNSVQGLITRSQRRIISHASQHALVCYYTSALLSKKCQNLQLPCLILESESSNEFDRLSARSCD